MKIRQNKRGLGFVALMIIIAIVAFLLSVGIESFLNTNILQNESDAQSTLKLISTALENYAKNNNGLFALNLSVLTQGNPPYLDKDYILKSPLRGYSYSCLRLDASGYNCSANPTKCSLTGRTIYSVTTGGILTSSDCSKKE
jgi:Tfp pilus assembly protein PilE